LTPKGVVCFSLFFSRKEAGAEANIAAYQSSLEPVGVA